MKIKSRWLLAASTLALLIMAAVWAWHTKEVDRVSREAISELYVWPMTDLDGHRHTLSEWGGQPVLINFWASWCLPCRLEMPALDQFSKTQARRIKVIGVAWDTPEAVAAYARSTPVSYPLLTLGNTANFVELLVKLGNAPRGLPFSVLIDAKARIRLIKLGAISQEELLAGLQTALDTEAR